MIASESLRMLLYSNLAIIGWLVSLVYMLTQYKIKKEAPSYAAQLIKKSVFKKPNKLGDIVFFVLECILIFSIVSIFSTFLNTYFGELMKTGPNYFGFVYFIPIILIVYFCIVWVDPIKQMDFITPCFPIALFFTRLGCFAYGCCFGVEWEHGLYNYKNEAYEFPAQLSEAFIALGLFVFLLFWRKKAKPGTLFPTYIIFYSGIRFFNEFLCSTPARYLIFFSKYQILCIIGVVLGLVQYLLVLKYGEKISNYFNEHPYGFVKHFKNKKA